METRNILANKILILANYFGIQKSDLTKKDELLTDKNINRKREIIVYKDFPAIIKFDNEKEKPFSNIGKGHENRIFVYFFL